MASIYKTKFSIRQQVSKDESTQKHDNPNLNMTYNKLLGSKYKFMCMFSPTQTDLHYLHDAVGIDTKTRALTSDFLPNTTQRNLT